MCLQLAAPFPRRHDSQLQYVLPGLRDTVYVLPPSFLNEVSTTLNVVMT
jgi:hypothetical protein